MPRFIHLILVGLVVLNFSLVHRLLHSEGEWSQYRSLRLKLNREQQIQRELLEKNLSLQAEVVDLKQGDEILSEIARYDLGLVREGEYIIYLIGEDRKIGEHSRPLLSTTLPPPPSID